MAHSYSCHYFHIVFSTKGRAHLIPQDHLDRLHAYVAGVVRKIGAEALQVGGTTDHLHLLAAVPAPMAIPQLVNKAKANSSRWARSNIPTMREFAWQEGYGSFTVSRSNVEAVRRYVEDQARHHGAMSFEDEYLALLQKHGIEFEPEKALDR